MPDVLYSSYILRDHGQAGDIRATADECSSLFEEFDISHAPVVENDQAIGIVRLLSAGARWIGLGLSTHPVRSLNTVSPHPFLLLFL